MKPAALAVVAVMTAAALGGCLGDDKEAFDPFAFKPTGRTVELRMWVEDHQQQVWPGFEGAFWAFCIEPFAGSEDAVEYNGNGEPCSVPGPTIRVQQGDRLIVHFENPHMFPHTVHWHGQHLPNAMDGVPGSTQDTVVQGSSYLYDYIVERPGTLVYHCHVDTQHHLFMGLYGAILVEPQDRRYEPRGVDVEHTLIMSHANKEMMDAAGGGHDHSAHQGGAMGSGDPGKQNNPFETEYDVFMLNGKSFPTTIQHEDSYIQVQEGDRLRMRLVNLGFLEETMHLHGHDMLVTHKDGLPLQKGARWYADTLNIGPGERYDVLVEANQPGKWVFHTHYANHVANDHQYPGGMLTQLVYEGFEDQKFEAELPGGGAEAPKMVIPPPFFANYTDDVTAADYAREWNMRLAHPGGTGSVDFSLQSGSPADALLLEILDPQDEVILSQTVDAETTEVQATLEDLTAGDHTVRISGIGVQATFLASVQVEFPPMEAGGAHDDEHGGDHH